MSERKDLTRWNRAGLTRFRYVDGKAVEYLEILRQQLVDKFKDPETERCEWLNPAEEVPANEKELDNETLIQRQERLSRKQERILEMYNQGRRDWAWEITRTFARSCHILTEHANAFTNEGYLGTATQWENVRRLVEMIDYHPAPPASAYTRLVLIAKEPRKGGKPRTGIVTMGFQVMHSPADGGDNVVFETLEDLFIDSALNELRPKGWDQSEEPALPPDDNGKTQSPVEERQFSSIANGLAIHIKDMDEESVEKLDALVSPETFKIKDFLDLDPGNSGTDIASDQLWEWKAKADILINFAPEGNWTSLETKSLTYIAGTRADSLAEESGNSLELAEALKLEIEKIDICMEYEEYEKTSLGDLFTPVAIEAGTVVTSWKAKQKPKIAPGEVSMICHEIADENRVKYVDKAVAATIAGIEKHTEIIHVIPGTVPIEWTKWTEWSKGEARLKVSPRWKRKCWLNGVDVVRTEEPHGLSEGAFISWEDGGWQFAEVIEADKRDLRLRLIGSRPDSETLIYEALPLKGPQVPAVMEAFGAVTEEVLVELVDYTLKVATEASELFTLGVLDRSDPGGNVPPLMPPGGLDFGSFLFPSPMLPVDLVKAAVELLLSMGIMEIPSTGDKVFKFLSDPGAAAKAIVDKINEAIPLIGGSKWEIDSPYYDKVLEFINPPGTEESVLYKEISTELAEQLEKINSPLLGIPKDPLIKAIVQASDPLYMFNGSSKIGVGDWIVGKFSDGLRALKVSTINWFTDSDKTETFSLSFEKLEGNKELKKVYADFRGELIPEGATINSKPVEDEIELDEVPESLKIGRDVLLTGEGKDPVAAKIESIVGNIITTSPSPTDFTKGNLVIRGNVVLAGHGDRKPEKILGSGNAAKSNQEFTLEVENISFTPDGTKSSGVAAAIEVDVAGRIWEQVSTLKDSAPGDHHYAIRMTEEGYVKIIFGDGEHGRRLPTGNNNIRVRYSVGSGLGGNVPAGSLEEPVNPHHLVKEVHQPLNAAGGGDMEDVASLRENAPSTLLALERAVSLSDFSHLAASQSSVWQAKAYSRILHGGRTENVMVVIVPAAGVTSDDILVDMKDFLQKQALPGVKVFVENFLPLLFDLKVTIRVKIDEFIVEEVEIAVESALEDHFKLQNRKLGEYLYLSEVYKVVEGVKGVENSICVLNDDKTIQLVRAGNESMVVYLDTGAKGNQSTLDVTHEEYQP